MRVWDQIPPQKLCRKHLLAEHRETLCIWSVITNNKTGYSKHPETLRWMGHLGALWLRHDGVRKEATKRGYDFKDLPDWLLHLNSEPILTYLNPEPIDNQLETLKLKGCECKI